VSDIDVLSNVTGTRYATSPDGELLAPCDTDLAAEFQRQVNERPDQPALRTLDGSVNMTWGDYGRAVRQAANVLHSLGVRRGGVVAFLLRNRPEFHVYDVAATHLGAVTFSIYNTSSPEQIAYIVADADPRLLVVEDDWIHRTPPQLSYTVSHLQQMTGQPTDSTLDFDEVWRRNQPDDVAAIVYTSGTTGPPKGVQLTHRNIIHLARGFGMRVKFAPGATLISYLPAAHLLERNGSHYWGIVHGFSIVSCPDPREITDAIARVRPSYFGGAPRVFEKLRVLGTADLTRYEVASVDEALRQLRSGHHPNRDDAVLRKVRATMGLDRIEGLMSVGGAPVQRDLVEFFHAVGLPLGEIWGLTEATGGGTMNPLGKDKIGSSGPPAPGMQLRLAEDGEIELLGPTVMAGYLNNPEATAAAFTSDGWLKTGDIGVLDDDGYLRVVDRKKELIINAAGKNMSPSNIESKIKADFPLIGSVVAVGDGRPYNVALIVLEPAVAAVIAEQKNLAVADIEELSADAAIVGAVAEQISKANADLSQVEQVKRFHILGTWWIPGGDELTPTMKLRRKAIHTKYRAEIESLYSANHPGHPALDQRHI